MTESFTFYCYYVLLLFSFAQNAESFDFFGSYDRMTESFINFNAPHYYIYFS